MIKKVCRQIKLKKFKTELNEDILSKWDGNEFMVIYNDGTTNHCLCKSELYRCLEKDHIKPIRYIFDMNDRIYVSRDIIIDLDKI